MNEHEKEEERIRKILRRRFVEDVIEGEVRIYEKSSDGLSVHIATMDDFPKLKEQIDD